MTRKILRELRRLAPEAAVSIDGRNHYRLSFADGCIVTVAGTPSCQRAARNMAADIRRQLRRHPHGGDIANGGGG